MASKAKLKKAPDGLYEVHYPDGTSVWCYTKDRAHEVVNHFNTTGKKSR